MCGCLSDSVCVCVYQAAYVSLSVGLRARVCIYECGCVSFCLTVCECVLVCLGVCVCVDVCLRVCVSLRRSVRSRLCVS